MNNFQRGIAEIFSRFARAKAHIVVEGGRKTATDRPDEIDEARMRTWTFHSFSMERFLHYFGHSTAAEAEQMAETATWEDRDSGASVDLEQIGRIVRRVATSGLSYEGLSEAEAQILDQRLRVLFSPWGFEEQLDLEHESPEPYAYVLEVEERVTKDVEVRFLPMLNFGWRYGTTNMEPEPYYFIFHPEHVEALAEEVSKAMANPEPWSDEFFKEMTEQNLVQVLKSVISKKKGLAGVLTEMHGPGVQMRGCDYLTHAG